jgi:hypothetical protein
MLLHPRVPPLVRSLPHVESLSLFRTEESQEEAEAREALDLTYGEASSHPERPPSIQDVQMKDETRLSLSENESTESPPLQAQISTAPMPLPGRLSSLAIEQPVLRNSPPQPPTLPSAPSSRLLPPSVSAPEKNVAPINMVPQSSAPQLHPIIASTSEEEDEEMPAINLDSDSDGD